MNYDGCEYVIVRMLAVERVLYIEGFVRWVKPECRIVGVSERYLDRVTIMINIESGDEWYTDAIFMHSVHDDFYIGDNGYTLTVDAESDSLRIVLWRRCTDWVFADITALVDIPRCGNSQINIRAYANGLIYATYHKYLIVLRVVAEAL